jgi:hypothetical protein
MNSMKPVGMESASPVAAVDVIAAKRDGGTLSDAQIDCRGRTGSRSMPTYRSCSDTWRRATWPSSKVD